MLGKILNKKDTEPTRDKTGGSCYLVLFGIMFLAAIILKTIDWFK